MESMNRDDLMVALERNAFAARIGLHRICSDAGVSGTVITRWRKRQGVPSIETIGKLETALANIMERVAS
jgi:DNA-binding phage protein